MIIEQFIYNNNLKQADAIKLKKKIIGMVDHYVLFLGYNNGKPVFIANYNKGIRVISCNSHNLI